MSFELTQQKCHDKRSKPALQPNSRFQRYSSVPVFELDKKRCSDAPLPDPEIETQVTAARNFPARMWKKTCMYWETIPLMAKLPREQPEGCHRGYQKLHAEGCQSSNAGLHQSCSCQESGYIKLR